ncbi:MAG: DUF1801 domain-containing protein [Rhizobium sp.]|nr:DUF1801 domain-containing protein [Rhizobium sp.]
MPTVPTDVQAAFDRLARDVRDRLLDVRAMIFEVAEGDPRIGPVAEMLKWGEPAYLTTETGSGSTIRLGGTKGSIVRPAVLVNCRTRLVADFRDLFGTTFQYEGNRMIVLPDSAPGDDLKHLLWLALTYRLGGRERVRRC